MEKSDEELMAAFQAGDRAGLTVIFQRYKARILNFCAQILGNRADAEEVAGDVFLALLTSRFDGERGVKFSTWFYTIARYKCIDCLRDRKRWAMSRLSGPGKEGQEWFLTDGQESHAGEIMKAEIGEHVRQAIQKLPPEQREAIVLRQFHDFSYQEIGGILNCSLEKVKILIFRAKENLRAVLSSYVREERS